MKNISSNIKQMFIKGLVTLLPILMTFYIVKLLLSFISNFITNSILNINNTSPLICCIIFFLVIIILGYLTTFKLVKKIISKFESFLNKIPIISSLYATMKDIVNVLGNKQRASFRNVVLVNFPSEQSQSIGFITNEDISLNDEKKIAVFVPTTPNPTNGFLLYIDPRNIRLVNLGIDEAIKIVMSMGSITTNNNDWME
ncbi:MAG: DUF502 domain-containing protein [Eubacteriaceae bacterium]